MMTPEKLHALGNQFQVLFFIMPPGESLQKLRALWEEIRAEAEKAKSGTELRA